MKHSTKYYPLDQFHLGNPNLGISFSKIKEEPFGTIETPSRGYKAIRSFADDSCIVTKRLI